MRLRWFSSALGCATLALATFASPVHCYAQKTQPSAAATTESSDDDDESVVVVAVNAIDTVVPNIQHLARTVGLGAGAGMVTTMVNQYANGLDRKRPIGVFVSLDDSGNPVPIGCLPLSDLDAFFEQLSVFGEANDLGDGLYEFSIGNSIYAKKVGEWLYVAQTEDALSDVEEDLGNGLAKMVAKYDIRIQVNPQNIPEQMVEFFMSQMKAGLERGMAAQQANLGEEDAASTQEASEQMIAQMEEGIQATEKIVIGLTVNKQEKRTNLDFGSQFVADSKYAKQVEKLKTAKAAFTGIPQESSMMTLLSYQLVEADQIAQLERTLDTSLKTAFKQIDDNSKDEASATKAKELINKLVDIFMESAKQGQMESAVDVTVEKALGIVATFGVANGSKVEALAAEIAQEAAKEKSVKFELNTGKHAGFNLHKVSVTLPPQADDAARKIFGDSVTISIGTAPKSVIVSVGKNSDAGLKSAIDRAAAKPSGTAESIKMRLVLSQLLNYIQSIESTPISEAMLNAATPGNDRIMIDSTLISRGMVVRLSLEDGVLKAISAGVKAGQSANGGGF